MYVISIYSPQTLIAEVVNLPAASQLDWPGVYICIVKFPAARLGAH